MNRNRQSLLALILGVLVSRCAAEAQSAPPAILQIDLENRVLYVEDVFDLTKFAKDPNVTPPAAAANFQSNITIGDIVAVNGQPARGTFVSRTQTVHLTPTPAPGQAIADTAQTVVINIAYEIQNADGKPIGSIMTAGFGGVGTPPPGSPLRQVQGNQAIVGGTGAFLGARGQQGGGTGLNDVPTRNASIAEDPANRRKNGGGRNRELLVVIPLSRPEIAGTPTGPAVFHADFSPVTAAKPAKPGEVLIVKATGMGPTVPGVDPGQPFPLDALQPVNSPVAVSVNGQSAQVVSAIGWPGQIDTYRVDFRLSDAIASGRAAIQLTAAWIPGAAVSIPVQ